jgi:hypothetical protein
MNTIFTVDDPENFIEKINLDDLYEKKKQHALSTTQNYNKILNRIHNRIKTTSRTQLSEQFCWFLIPEMMIGVPKYVQSECIAYIIDKLQNNGFKIRYTHPNLLFISWNHWVPGYVRTELKKKTGISIDGNGNILKSEDDANNEHKDANSNLLMFKNSNKKEKSDSDTKSINSYKPSGNLIYNNDILNSLSSNLDKK